MDGPNFKICEVKKLSNWLSNFSTEILHKNKQLQYWQKNEVAYKKNIRVVQNFLAYTQHWMTEVLLVIMA